MGVRAKQVVAIIAGLVLAGVMVVLGLWQQASYEESTRDVSAERAAMDPLPLAEYVGEDGTITEVFGRRVTVSGEYLDVPAVRVGTDEPLRVVNALEMDGGHILAVVRGVTDGDPSPPPAGTQSIEAIFLAPDLPADDPAAPGADLASLRIQSLAQEWPSPMLAGYITLNEADAAAQGLQAAALELPEAEGSATHRGYALQWWVFAAGAIAFGVYAARGIAKDEEKRRSRAAVKAQR